VSWTPPADPAGDAEAADALARLAQQVREAQRCATPLVIAGGGSKSFLLEPLAGEVLDMRAYRGVLAYEPAELVIEVRAGTPLLEVETLLAAHGQCLASEPPRPGSASTIGGAVAAGFSGPARPWAGALRDHVLGVGLISPAGDLLRFGGRVMKNVAGYDVSRLVTGAWGTFGPIATLALRVAPRPESTRCAIWEMDAREGLARMLRLARESWPLTGAAHEGRRLRLRFAGAAAAVDEALAALAPDAIEADDGWWQSLRDWELPVLRERAALWRVSLPPATVVDAPGDELIDWGGAQRWWSTSAAPGDLHARLHAVAGRQAHALPMFAAPTSAQPALSPAQRSVQQRLREAFDPALLFNRGCSRTAA